MLFRTCKHAVLSLAIVGLLGTANTSFAAEGDRDRSSRSKKGSEKEEIKYPNATRVEPKAKGASKLDGKRQKLVDAYNKQDYPTARQLADEMLASHRLHGAGC